MVAHYDLTKSISEVVTPNDSNPASSSSSPCKDMSTGTTSVKAELLPEIWSRYHAATASKLYEVEELIDYYFHRRLAAVLAVIVSYLPFVITPNQITLLGLFLGWCSAACAYDAHFNDLLGLEPKTAWLTASALMFWWIVSDCADGQVARLCKRGTRTGRILDGLVDGLVVVPNCYVVALICSDVYGENFFYFGVLAGLSLWAHTLLYDKIKNLFTESVEGCEVETVESVLQEFLVAKQTEPWTLNTILLGVYYGYLQIQGWVSTENFQFPSMTARFTFASFDSSAPVSSATASEKDHLKQRASVARTPEPKKTTTQKMSLKAYMDTFSGLVRLASFMGLSAHVVGFYIAYFMAAYSLSALVVLQLYFVVALNCLFIVALLQFTSKNMMSCSVNRKEHEG